MANEDVGDLDVEVCFDALGTLRFTGDFGHLQTIPHLYQLVPKCCERRTEICAPNTGIIANAAPDQLYAGSL